MQCAVSKRRVAPTRRSGASAGSPSVFRFPSRSSGRDPVNRNSNFLLLGSLIAGVVVLGVGLLKHGHTEKPQVGACGDTAPAYWYDPMVPQQRFDKPGKSPFMDMQLVPKCGTGPGAPSGEPTPNSASAEKKPLYWFDPMKPQQHFDKPGKSP